MYNAIYFIFHSLLSLLSIIFPVSIRLFCPLRSSLSRIGSQHAKQYYYRYADGNELVATAVTEGRVCALEFDRFWFVDGYTPNAQNELARIDYRMQWEDDLRAYLQGLDAKKPVILCGDMNVAHEEIDLKNPGPNRGAAGFSDQERGKMTELLGAGFVDTFRCLHPDATGMYSWWSMRFRARERNAGWRIDYFIVSERLRDKIAAADILMDIQGSDHCPVTLTIDL